MITDRFVETPDFGFRYTHDVLWRAERVGYAMEVEPLQEADDFSWHVFAQFYESGFARAAIASDDVVQTTLHFDPLVGSKRRKHEDHGICRVAKYVKLRGPRRSGDFCLVLRDIPLPEPGIDQNVDSTELSVLREIASNVVAW